MKAELEEDSLWFTQWSGSAVEKESISFGRGLEVFEDNQLNKKIRLTKGYETRQGLSRRMDKSTMEFIPCSL